VLVLLDGEVVAAWGGSQALVTILALASLDEGRRQAIEGEARGILLSGGPPDVVCRQRR